MGNGEITSLSYPSKAQRRDDRWKEVPDTKKARPPFEEDENSM
jgi:hypothetical protein